MDEQNIKYSDIILNTYGFFIFTFMLHLDTFLSLELGGNKQKKLDLNWSELK